MSYNCDDLSGAAETEPLKMFSVFGLSEEALHQRLVGFEVRFPDVELVVEPVDPILLVKICPREAAESVVNAARWVSDELGSEIFSDKGQSMEQVVGRLLLEKNATLALAESCTGGLIANLMTDVPGSSDYFVFSAVTYANQAKINVLDVKADTLERFGAVSEQTAIEMAMGARRLTEAAYSLATSGIAGPAGGSADKPVGTLCVGLASPSEVIGHRFHIEDRNRLMNKRIFAFTALDLLRQKLLDA